MAFNTTRLKGSADPPPASGAPAGGIGPFVTLTVRPGTGPGFQLEAMEAVEELGRPFLIVPDVSAAKPENDLRAILGGTATVKLDHPGKSSRHFSGIVTRLQHRGLSSGGYRYQVGLRPWTWLLSREQDCRIFQNKSPWQITTGDTEPGACTPRDHNVRAPKADSTVRSRIAGGHAHGSAEMYDCPVRRSSTAIGQKVVQVRTQGFGTRRQVHGGTSDSRRLGAGTKFTPNGFPEPAGNQQHLVTHVICRVERAETRAFRNQDEIIGTFRCVLRAVPRSRPFRLAYALPDNRTPSTTRSSSALGGSGFNEGLFEDKKGAEEIYMHAQKDFNEVVLGSRTEGIGGDTTTTLNKGNGSFTVNGNDKLKVSGDAPHTLEGKNGNTVSQGRTGPTVNIN